MKIIKIFLLVSSFFFAFISCGEVQEEEKSNPDSVSQKKEIAPEPVQNRYPDFRYSILRSRKTISLKNDSLQSIIDKFIDRYPGAGIDSLIDIALILTANQLQFSFGKCSSDPNQLQKDAPANCVGYAALFNSCMNYTLKKAGLSNQYSCKHHVGKIWRGDKEITALINDPFFSDHDFNTIENLQTGEMIAVDPSLYDYLGYNRILLKEK